MKYNTIINIIILLFKKGYPLQIICLFIIKLHNTFSTTFSIINLFFQYYIAGHLVEFRPKFWDELKH